MDNMKTYRINEIFSTLQGEGINAGTPCIFVRFSACNQACRQETHGFDCDTEFVSGRKMTMDDLTKSIKKLRSKAKWIVLTGGEPALQVDKSLISTLHKLNYRLAIETNGSIKLPSGIDWITVSPKVAEHAIRQRKANEVKYVRKKGQQIPKTVVKADHYFISPAFKGHGLDKEDLNWCVQLVKKNPEWKLSVQQHKIWGIR